MSVVYGRSARSKGRQPSGAVLHLSHEPGELSQCFQHVDSTIKIILVLSVGNKRPPCLTCQLSCSCLGVARWISTTYKAYRRRLSTFVARNLFQIYSLDNDGPIVVVKPLLTWGQSSVDSYNRLKHAQRVTSYFVNLIGCTFRQIPPSAEGKR